MIGRKVEHGLRAQRYRCVVATSSLDLGVDFPAVDQVIQLGSPKGSARLLQRYEEAMSFITVMPLDTAVAEPYATLRGQLERAAPPIGPNDLLIAAHALALGATLVSADAEFQRVPGYPVYHAPNAPGNYFFYDGLYWVFQSDNWYSSGWYNGPWQQVGPDRVPLFLLRARVWARHAGYSEEAGVIAVREGWLDKSWRFAEIRKLQSLQLAQSPFDRRHGMASLLMDTVGASPFEPPLRVRYLPLAEAIALRDRLAAAMDATPTPARTPG